MTNESLASSVVTPQPRSLRRRLSMSVLLVVVLIPLVFGVFLFGFLSMDVLSESTFGAVGTAFARWRYEDRFERQFAELTTCLEQSLASVPGEEALVAAESCFAAAELRSELPIELQILAPIDGELRWREVRYVDSSLGLHDLHEEQWSDGLHLISVPFVGRSLLYVRTLPEQGEPGSRALAYSIVVPLSEIR